MTDAQTTAPDILRDHAETAYADELLALAAADDRPRPPSWRLSPWAVATYILGGTLSDGTVVTPKYLGSARLVEIAVASLATDRAPAAARRAGHRKDLGRRAPGRGHPGTSTLVVQGTAGTPEEALRYGWNYARLLAEGPSRAALVPGPVMRAMESGQPRAGRGAHPDPGGRAGRPDHDPVARRHCRSPSSTPRCRRARDSTSSPPPTTATRASTTCPRHCAAGSTPSCCRCPTASTGGGDRRHAASLARRGPGPAGGPARARRDPAGGHGVPGAARGLTQDGRTTLKSPSATLSTAEAISVMTNGLSLAAHFGDGSVRADDVAAGLVGAVVKDPVQDRVVWQEYLETVVRNPPEWERPLPGLPRASKASN